MNLSIGTVHTYTVGVYKTCAYTSTASVRSHKGECVLLFGRESLQGVALSLGLLWWAKPEFTSRSLGEGMCVGQVSFV